jgi:hypothetical protein
MCQRNETKTDIVIADCWGDAFPVLDYIGGANLIAGRVFYLGSCVPSVLPFNIPVAVLVSILTGFAKIFTTGTYSGDL